MKVLLLLSCVISLASCYPLNEDLFKISIVHMNDFHARFEESNTWGGTCKDDMCIGGLSRAYKQFSEIKKRNPNVISLNAGDNFQGTLWYSTYKWNVTQEFLNKFNYDALTLGNHEFDDGVAGVVPFIKALNCPVVASNIDDSLEPDFQGIYNKSVVIERQGKKIGIIGVVTKTTTDISSPGKLKFNDHIESVNEEAERLVKEEGVFTNIVLSHCGYDEEQKIAAAASPNSKITVVIGGHSHTFLYTGTPSPGPDKVRGPYPTIVSKSDGNTVLVTQASCYNKYFGLIDVLYNEKGDVVSWNGSPTFLNHDLPQDEEFNKAMIPWKEGVDKIGKRHLGYSLVNLTTKGCYYQECLEGNFVTDAMAYAYIDKAEPGSWTYASIAVFNPGGCRTDIEEGNITYADLVDAQPFENTVDVSEIKGKYLRQLFEDVKYGYHSGRMYVSTKMLQVSGVKVVFDLENQTDIVQSLKVLCRECTEKVYEDVEDEKIYRIITPSFLTNVGDGYAALKHLENTQVGEIDIHIFERYLKEKSPIFQEIEGRITVLHKEKIVTRNLDDFGIS